jgi:RHS repeat-associated protein
MPMPNTQTTDNQYRYAFQGQEKDPETGMEAFELRLWDGRLGRWLTVDPAHAHFSPYLGMANNPISEIDPDGGCPCSKCPENCKGSGANKATDSDLSFPDTSGLQQLEEVIVRNNYHKESNFYANIHDLFLPPVGMPFPQPMDQGVHKVTSKN